MLAFLLQTALMYAAVAGCDEVLLKLLQAGAIRTLQDVQVHYLDHIHTGLDILLRNHYSPITSFKAVTGARSTLASYT